MNPGGVHLLAVLSEEPCSALDFYFLGSCVFPASRSVPSFIPSRPRGDNTSEHMGWGCCRGQQCDGGFFQPFWGRMADRYGRKPMMIRAGIFLGLIYYATGLSTAAWHVALCRLLNGALTGFVPGAVALAATNTPRHLSARYVASLHTANAAGTIIGPAIGGMLAEAFGFRGALRASGTIVLLCTLLVLILVEEKEKKRTRPTTTLWEDTVKTLTHPVLLVVMITVAFTAFTTSGIQPMLALYLNRLGDDSPKWLSGIIFSLPGIAFVLTAGLWTRLGERKGLYRAHSRCFGAIGYSLHIFELCSHHFGLLRLVLHPRSLCGCLTPECRGTDRHSG